MEDPRNILAEKTNTFYKSYPQDLTKHYVSYQKGTIRLDGRPVVLSQHAIGEEIRLSSTLFDAGGLLVHINYKNTSADIGKYATYQCTECLIFEKKCFVADGVIKCIDCLYNVVEKFELPHLRPTVMIGGEFSDKLFVKNKGLVMSGYNVYILGSHLNDDLESYVDCNQRYNKFGLPNKPLLIVNIPDSEYHQTPKKEIETYRYETIIKDDYKYASKPDFVYNFCKQSKLSTADTRNHLPAKLATPAWALVRYVCEMMRENFKVITSYRLYGRDGIPTTVTVDTRVSKEMFNSSVTEFGHYFLWFEVFILYKAICKVLNNGDIALNLEDVIIALSGRRLGSKTSPTDNVFQYSSEKLFFNNIDLLTNTPTSEPVDKLERFSFMNAAEKLTQVGDFVVQKISAMQNSNHIIFQTGKRAGLYIMYTFHGINGMGKIFDTRLNKTDTINLNGGALVVDGGSVASRFKLQLDRENIKEDMVLTVITSYWLLPIKRVV